MSKKEFAVNSSGHGLKKNSIGVLGVTFMLYCLVAAGAFGIEEMIPASGPGMTILLLCVMPFIWAWPISSLVAECNSILPFEGGIYVWAKEAFGEFWGFQAGWWTAISTYVSSGAYVALVGGYAAQLLPVGEAGSFAIKVGMIALFTVINLIGLKQVEWVDNVLSIMIVLVFGVVAVLGFAHWHTNPVVPLVPSDISIMDGISEGICIAIWMYCGYECIATMSGEFESSRSVSIGLKIALPLIALSYILPTLGALACLPEGSWVSWAVDGGFDSESVGYATVIGMYLGNAGKIIFLLTAVVSQCAIYNTYMASGARSFFVLASDNLFPPSVAKTDKQGRSPYVGVLTITVSSLIFACFEFEALVEMEVVFVLATYVILSLAIFRLRKKYPLEERQGKGLYVIGGGKFGLWYCAVLPIVVSVFALLVNDLGYLVYSIGALLTGLVAYVLFKRLYGGLAKLDAEAHPLDPKTRLAQGDLKHIGIFCLACVALIVAKLLCMLVV